MGISLDSNFFSPKLVTGNHYMGTLANSEYPDDIIMLGMENHYSSNDFCYKLVSECMTSSVQNG